MRAQHRVCANSPCAAGDRWAPAFAEFKSAAAQPCKVIPSWKRGQAISAKTSERNHWERFWDASRDLDEIYSTQGRILRALEGIFEPEGKLVLEVGAGTGRDSQALAERGATVVTLDYADSAIRLISGLVSRVPRLYAVQGDAFAPPFRPGTFDLVFHQGLLEHFRDPLPLLRANVELLKPGGLLLVDVPQRYHLYTLVKHVAIWLDKWFAGWETEFSIGQLERLVRQVGMEPVRRYGDWMRPSFVYRASREALKAAGLRLPMYPPAVPVLHELREGLRKWAWGRKWAFYTYLDIGVIARKPAPVESEGVPKPAEPAREAVLP